jgi:hypothetical protein
MCKAKEKSRSATWICWGSHRPVPISSLLPCFRQGILSLPPPFDRQAALSFG